MADIAEPAPPFRKDRREMRGMNFLPSAMAVSVPHAGAAPHEPDMPFSPAALA